MTMRAGRLPHRVAIQANTATRAADGSEIAGWATITGGNVWALVQPLSGQERWQAQAVNATSTLTVTIRYIAGLTEKHRVLFGARVLAINSIANRDERNEMITLMCSEDK